MTTYQGKCHCGHHQWEVTLNQDQSKHILCHCDTCKILGGGAFTMNQVRRIRAGEDICEHVD